MPPALFWRAMSLPLNKIEVTARGQSPFINKLTKAVGQETSPEHVSLLEMRSRKCCGRTPSGPPADPAGKERTAAVMSSPSNWMAEKPLGSVTDCLSDGAGGWRSRRD